MSRTKHIIEFIYDSIKKSKFTFIIVITVIFILKAAGMTLPFVIGKIIDQLSIGTNSIDNLYTHLVIFFSVWILVVILGQYKVRHDRIELKLFDFIFEINCELIRLQLLMLYFFNRMTFSPR